MQCWSRDWSFPLYLSMKCADLEETLAAKSSSQQCWGRFSTDLFCCRKSNKKKKNKTYNAPQRAQWARQHLLSPLFFLFFLYVFFRISFHPAFIVPPYVLTRFWRDPVSIALPFLLRFTLLVLDCASYSYKICLLMSTFTLSKHERNISKLGKHWVELCTKQSSQCSLGFTAVALKNCANWI